MIEDPFPKDVKPNERSILIAYHLLKVKHPQDIAILLGRDSSFVYKTLKKYMGLNVNFVAPVPQFIGSGYYVVGK